MDYLAIINRYYDKKSRLYHILLTHSHSVCNKALDIVDRHPELHADRRFIEEAAMLHDIGIIRCNAPSIQCFGTEPYICHGRIGAEILRSEGYERHAGVCERHTGTGITKDQIIRESIPLPYQDFLPETIEEQIICYADKFFSKTHLDKQKTAEQVEIGLARFGEESVRRFRKWEEIMG